MSKQVLGKGLSALIDDGEDATSQRDESSQQEISIRKLQPGAFQPRGYFDEGSLLELSESIKKNGILQPLVVRAIKDGKAYEIIAGERRFRAAKMAGLQNIPVVIKNYDDKQALEIALIENIQRENLTPIEEAEGYKRLQSEFNYTQEQLGGVLGKSRSHIANMLRLLSLPQAVKAMINSGTISMSHARVLVGVEDPQSLAEKIVNEGLNVREAEKFASGSGFAGGGSGGTKIAERSYAPSSPEKDEDLLALERSLSESVGLKVSVEDSKKGGRVILYFNNLTELDKILQKIG
jgi:ParB family chromosome partitioning protein